MIIDVTRLNNGMEEFIEINTEYDFDDAYAKIAGAQKLNPTAIHGTISKNGYEDYWFEFDIKLSVILLCSVTLVPLEYPISVKIQSSLTEIMEEIDKNIKKTQNSIDILPIIWENILMEIPMKVVSPDLKDRKLSGEGWSVITEQEKQANPELSKLKDLL